jgi:hypothetical protein
VFTPVLAKCPNPNRGLTLSSAKPETVSAVLPKIAQRRIPPRTHFLGQI